MKASKGIVFSSLLPLPLPWGSPRTPAAYSHWFYYACLFTAVSFLLWHPVRILLEGDRHCPPPFTPSPKMEVPVGHEHASWQHPLLNASKGVLPTLCGFMGAQETAVFVHVNPNNAWLAVLSDMMRTMQHSLVYLCGAQFFYGFPRDVVWPYTRSDPNFLPAPPSSHYTLGAQHIEQVTLASLHEWCSSRPRAFVAYVHDKGVRRGPEDVTSFLRQADWRRLHEYFALEVPQGCFHALHNGFDTCGSELCGAPQAHYSGNFWWAKCSLINTLPHPYEYVFKGGPSNTGEGNDWYTFLSPEMWIGAVDHRMFNCWTKDVEHLYHEYPRFLYAGAQCFESKPVC